MIVIVIGAARSPCRIVCLARTCYTVYNVNRTVRTGIRAQESQALVPGKQGFFMNPSPSQGRNSKDNVRVGASLPIAAWPSRVTITIPVCRDHCRQGLCRRLADCLPPRPFPSAAPQAA